MKFLLGFVAGLLTGMMLILGPVVAIVATVLLVDKADKKKYPSSTVPVSYRGMDQSNTTETETPAT